MSTIASRKAKARRLQNTVADMIRAWCEGIDPEDIKTATMGETGSDIIMSPLAKELLPFDAVECKNREKLNIWQALEQMEKHGDRPVLFFSRNRAEIYVAMKAEDFFSII